MKISLNPVVDLKSFTHKYQLMNISLCKDGRLLVLLQELKGNSEEYEYIWHKLLPNYKILSIKQGNIKELFDIEDADISYSFIREMDDSVLLVSARCELENDEGIEKNARIFSLKGELIESFTLGDGIEDIKLRDTYMWVSYFDEGIFEHENPYGWSGLICLDNNRDIIYKHEPMNGHEHINDCYAMTVDKEGNLWFYYYSEFVLVKKTKEGLSYYDPKISGAKNLLISSKYIMMDGGSNKSEEFVVFKIEGIEDFTRVNFIDEKGGVLTSGFKYFDNSIGAVYENEKVYLFDLEKLKYYIK